MSRLIDADAAIEALTEYGNGRAVYIGAEEAVRRIEQLPSAQPYTIHSDGRLWVTVDDIDKVNAVVVDESKSKFCKQFYMDAQPERKTGRWIYGEDDGQDGWYCSECNGFVPWDYEYYGLDNIDFIDDFKVCPFCKADMVSRTGADMRGEQNE